ncbi:hypothetical protein [Nocardioides plantarum]|uniref:Lipoprotein n=1 Tax=Nocardioides plantarum TaxID=29299 RepID=A0ABV5K884_9ACTN|nr:hypothetical protein [Nocardioides plantarum]
MKTPTSRQRLAAVTVLAFLSLGLLAACGGADDEAGDTASAGTPSSSATPARSGASPAFQDAGGSGADDGQAQEDVFSVESPWNTDVLTAPIAATSEKLLQSSKVRTSVGFDGKPTQETVDEGIYVNTREWTTPIVAGGEPTVLTCRQVLCGDGGGKDITLDIPADVDPDPLYDGWFTVFDQRTRTAYDLWRARRENDGTISYHFMRTWDLDGPGFNQPYVVSARGSGLPLFGGVIRPGELERGQINHALAISIPGPAAGTFVQPASSTDGNNNNGDSLPEGARIRLKGDFQLAPPVDPETGKALPFDKDRAAYAAHIVDALKKYGAIVVDRAAVPTLYFQKVAVEKGRRPLLAGYELQSIGLEDFEVVDYSKQKSYPYPAEDQVVDASRLEFTGGVGTGSGTDTTGTTTDTTTKDDQ